MRFAALRTALAAGPLLLPLPATAGAFLTFSGVVFDGDGINVFGATGTTDLTGLAFSGSLRAGGVVGRSDDFLIGDDNEFLAFTRAALTFTINGVSESAIIVSGPGEPPFLIGVFNGINPRFGRSDTGFDDVDVSAFGVSPAGIAALEVQVFGDTEAVPGGFAPFSVATDGVQVNGALLALLLVGPNDDRGFFLTASEFTLTLVSVPAPGAAGLFGAGLLGLMGLVRRRGGG
jgi:hypothetical protein